MTAILLEGTPIAQTIKQNVAERATEFANKAGRSPKLVAMQVGENSASKLYTDMQARAAESVGIDYELRHFPENIPQDDLTAAIQMVNDDAAVDGLILQMPLPESLDSRAAQRAISPKKDAEGITLANLGQMFFDGFGIVLCTPASVITLLEATGENLAGKQAVVIGHSDIVGKPIALLLLQSPREAPTVTVCHVATKDLESHVRDADILITAAGVAQSRYRTWKANGKTSELNLAPLIPGDWIKPGAIVIDVATNRIPAGLDENGQPLLNAKGKAQMQTTGDVDFEAAKERAAYITPVPGGVGPITVAKLLENTIRCAEANNNA